VKMKTSKAQDNAIQNAYREFKDPNWSSDIAYCFSEIVRAVSNKDCHSVSFGTYGGEIQVTFWEKGKAGMSVADSFTFTSMAKFKSEMEERDLWQVTQ
jgi:hypothetical protein